MPKPSVIILGAGLAGLAAAHAASQAGAAVTVLEASARVGGRVRSERLPSGEVVELGGEWILGGYERTLALARRFGLGLAPMGADFARREAADVDAPLERQDAVAETLARLVSELRPAEADARTLGPFLDTLPPEPALAALRARYVGTCAADLAEVALAPAAEEGLLMPGGAGPSWRLADGNQALAEALGREVDVRLDAVVERVEDLGARFRVAGPGIDLAGDVVVVAVPLPRLRRLRFEPRPPTAVADAIEALGFGVASKLAVATRGPLAPRAKQSVAGPFWWWSSPDASGRPRGAVTAYAGSAEAQVALGTDRAGDGRIWLERLVALDAEMDPVGEPLVARWAAEPFVDGAYSVIPPGAAALMPALAEPAGRVVLAGEHAAGVAWHGTIEGAIRSGERAAAQAIAIAVDPAA